MGKKSIRFLSVGIFALAAMTVVGCTPKATSEVEKVIAEAQKMDRAELYKKAIEEINGKTLNGVGNSSRGKTAQEYFLNYLRGKKYVAETKEYVADAAIRAEFPDYKEDLVATINWTQPKNNQIFAQISNDVRSANPQLSMTLIQDGSQIQSKMLDTGLLLNYIPKEWKGDEASNGHPFALQSLNKVFMYNVKGTDKVFKNMWDFVAVGEKPMFMGLDSEPVGKNALLMMTRKDYSDVIKEAYEALPAGAAKTRVLEQVNALKDDAKSLGLNHESAPYALAWIKLWVNQFEQKTDDGPIMTDLAKGSASGQSALIVYSKLRSVTETEDSSKLNVKVAAYESGYAGVGGYMYKHYLQVLKTSPMPWTSVAFIHYMTTTMQGFDAWGKDIGGYSSDPAVTPDHSKDGYVGGVNTYSVLNDRGYTWWTENKVGSGRLVIEDPAYASSVSFTVGDWISLLDRPTA